MSLRSSLGAVRRFILCRVHRRTVALGPSGPFVSFTFDDFPRTAHTVGGAILKKYEVRGTYYVAMGLMDTSNELGEQFRLEDLNSLSAAGHEIASHTFNHYSSRKVSRRRFREDVQRGLQAIDALGNLHPTKNFAFPYGEASIRAKFIIGREMMSCRGTQGGFNGPSVDLNLLRANSLYGSIKRQDEIGSLIEENKKRKSWLIFYTHDISPAPSSYGCTPELLEFTTRLAVESGAKVKPVVGVLNEILGPS